MTFKGRVAVYLAIAGLFAVLLAGLIVQSLQIRALEQSAQLHAVGTYVTGAVLNGDGAYLVFEADGGCAQYEPFGVVERGTYQQDGVQIRMDFAGQPMYAVWAEGQLHVFSARDDKLRVFEKQSDTPTYLNVQG